MLPRSSLASRQPISMIVSEGNTIISQQWVSKKIISSIPNNSSLRYFSSKGPTNPFATKTNTSQQPTNPFAAANTKPNPLASTISKPNPFAQQNTPTNPFNKTASPQKSAMANPFAQPNANNPFAHSPNVTTQTPAALNPFAQKTGQNPFAQPKAATNPFAAPATANPFAQPKAANPFANANPFMTQPKPTQAMNPFSATSNSTEGNTIASTNPFAVPQGGAKQVSNTNPFTNTFTTSNVTGGQGSVFGSITNKPDNIGTALPRKGGKDLIESLRNNVLRKAEQARAEAMANKKNDANSSQSENSFLGVLRQMNRRSKKSSRDLFDTSQFGLSANIKTEREKEEARRLHETERAAVASDLYTDLSQLERKIMRDAKTKKVAPIYTVQTIRSFSKVSGLHSNRIVESLVELISDGSIDDARRNLEKRRKDDDYTSNSNTSNASTPKKNGAVNISEFTPNYMLTQEQAENICILNNIEPMIYNTTSPEEIATLLELIDDEVKDDLPNRSPVVSIMGHVDHGKTTLLDSYRKTSVAEGEAGRITQSIGSFSVEIDSELHDFVPSVTFLDTPGHAIFSKMREKGTKNGLADIVILVLSAADSVQPQTREVVQLAREADRPIIVAITKCDIDGVNPDHVRHELADELDVICEQLGGDVPSVNVSARTGEGLHELLETIALQATALNLKFRPRIEIAKDRIEDWIDIQDAFVKGEGLVDVRAKQEVAALRSAVEEFPGTNLPSKSHPEYKMEKEILYEQREERMKEILKSNELSHLADFALGYAYVVETQVQRGAGVLVNAVVRQGEIRVGDHIVCGSQHATVRSLIDHNGVQVQSATAHKSAPVQILGIPHYDGLGDDIIIVPHERMAVHLTESRAKEEIRRQAILELSTQNNTNNRPNVERDYVDRGRRSRALQYQESDDSRRDEEADTKTTLRLVVKSDVNGSLEAIQGYIKDLALSPYSELARATVIKSGLGDITEQDIDFAQAREAIVVGFNVKIPNKVSQYARDVKVTAETSNVIFRTFDVIRNNLSLLLPPKISYDIQGSALVEMLFNLSFTKVALKKLAFNRGDNSGNPMEVEPKCIVAGSRVVSGELLANLDFKWRIRRDSETFAEDLELAQLRHFKDEVQSVPKGKDCGILLAKSSLVQVGDTLECYKLRNEVAVYQDTAARGHKEDVEFDYNSTLKYNEHYELVTMEELLEQRASPKKLTGK